MSHFSNKSKYLRYLGKRHRDAKSNIQNLKGKKHLTYAEWSLLLDTDGYSLSIVKDILSDQIFEYIQSYKLDLNIRDIRMLQITLNTIEKYWYSGLFTGTCRSQYKQIIKKYKKQVYTSFGMDYYTSKRTIEMPILPHVMKGIFRLYCEKIDMPKDIINIVFKIFDGERMPKLTHKDVKKVEELCISLVKKLKGNINVLSEAEVYPHIIEHFGQDYFLTKDPDRSRWDEWRICESVKF